MVAAEQPRRSVLARAEDIPALVRSLGFATPRPVLVLIGGASGLADADVDRLTDHLRRYALPSIQQAGAVVVDGGTDSGVMRAIGRVRRDSREPFPLIGVIARGVAHQHADATSAHTLVEGNHTNIIVVPGRTWGDEVPWLGRITTAISKTQPSVTLLVNGGEIAYQDMRDSLRRDRPVVVLAGSGRTADEVAAAADGPGTGPTAARQLAASPLTIVVPYGDGPRLREVLDILLGPAIITR
jgi:hypothetical protein